MDAKYKIKTFKQERKHIADFIIKFKVLVMKAKTNEMYAIFLLKNNVRANIIKKILEYPLIVVLEILKVGREYKFLESQNNYKIGTEMIYGSRETLMNIGKSRDNFDKDEELRYINYNIYGHMAKDC